MGAAWRELAHKGAEPRLGEGLLEDPAQSGTHATLKSAAAFGDGGRKGALARVMAVVQLDVGDDRASEPVCAAASVSIKLTAPSIPRRCRTRRMRAERGALRFRPLRPCRDTDSSQMS